MNIMKLQLQLLMKVDLSPNNVHHRTQFSTHPQLQPTSTAPSQLSDLHISNAKNIAGFLHLCRSPMSDHSLLQGQTKEPLSSGATTGSSPLAFQESYRDQSMLNISRIVTVVGNSHCWLQSETNKADLWAPVNFLRALTKEERPL